MLGNNPIKQKQKLTRSINLITVASRVAQNDLYLQNKNNANKEKQIDSLTNIVTVRSEIESLMLSNPSTTLQRNRKERENVNESRERTRTRKTMSNLN